MYKPFNCIESIDKLIKDLQKGKLEYSDKALFEGMVLQEIRKIKIQIYFKEQFENLPTISTNTNINSKIFVKKDLKRNIGRTSPNGIILKPDYEKNSNSPSRKRVNIKSESSQNNNPTIQTKILLKYESGKSSNKSNVNYKIKSIQYYSEKLKCSTKQIIGILKGKGIVKTEEDSLSSKELNIVKSFIESSIEESRQLRNSRKKTMNPNRPHKTNNNKKEMGGYNQNYKKGFGSSTSDSVFDRMSIFGTGGRIINIRTK